MSNISDDAKDSSQKITFTPAVRKRYEKIYGIAGNHSGVQICSWNKKALRGKGVCYKQIFYGIDCHRCSQMSPALAWCQENCIFCWRPMEWMKQVEMDPDEVDPPEEIIKKIVERRRMLLIGIGGAEDVDKKLFREAVDLFPSHWAISLSGEPTIYPRMDEFILLLKKHPEVKSVFLVSNGQNPDVFRKMAERNALPTQLYISVDAQNREIFNLVNRSVYKDGWERLNETLSLLPSLKCRRVLRFTMIKGLNDVEEHIPLYASLFEKSHADFIEVKAYMFLGLSRQRLKKENMPVYEEVFSYSKKLESVMGNYEIISAHAPSRIVLFKRKDSPYPTKIDFSKK